MKKLLQFCCPAFCCSLSVTIFFQCAAFCCLALERSAWTFFIRSVVAALRFRKCLGFGFLMRTNGSHSMTSTIDLLQGRGCSTLVELKPRNLKVVGSDPAEGWAFLCFFSLSFPTFLHQWSVLIQVPQGGTSLSVCCEMDTAWGKTGSDWVNKIIYCQFVALIEANPGNWSVTKT